MRIFKKVAIVGLGLIGGSLGLAIKEKRLACEVIGISRKKKTIKSAKMIGAIDEGCLNIAAVRGCDLVILCAPVKAIIELISAIAPHLSSGCIVTDAGSTKSEIVKKAQDSLPEKIYFIGGHPLAGSEKRGINNANGGLFNSSLCILTPAKHNTKEAINKTKLLWEKIGANVRIIDADMHDKIVASTSHLPHLAAFSLMESIPDNYLAFGANSLKDATRVAASDPLLWSQIFITNKKPILNSVKIFQGHLSEFSALIRRSDSKTLLAKIQKIKSRRQKLSL